MIEKIVLDWLNEQLDVPCYTEEKENMPAVYVLIEKVGGTEENLIGDATLAIQSYADTLYKAAELNKRVKRAMKHLIELDVITRSKRNSDYNYTDTARKIHRYQAVYDLKYYEEE